MHLVLIQTSGDLEHTSLTYVVAWFFCSESRCESRQVLRRPTPQGPGSWSLGTSAQDPLQEKWSELPRNLCVCACVNVRIRVRVHVHVRARVRVRFVFVFAFVFVFGSFLCSRLRLRSCSCLVRVRVRFVFVFACVYLFAPLQWQLQTKVIGQHSTEYRDFW